MPQAALSGAVVAALAALTGLPDRKIIDWSEAKRVAMPAWNPATQKIAATLQMVKMQKEMERQREEEIEKMIEAKVAQALRLLRR